MNADEEENFIATYDALKDVIKQKHWKKRVEAAWKIDKPIFMDGIEVEDYDERLLALSGRKAKDNFYKMYDGCNWKEV